jgi:two-component sensor histidine kinase
MARGHFLFDLSTTMDSRITACPGLSTLDLEQLQRIEAGMPITADVSRADLLLCCLLSPNQALVAQHAMPKSIPSLYRQPAVGRILALDEYPLLATVFQRRRGARRQRELLSSGAPVVQDVFPIYGPEGNLIAALSIETNLIAHERQKRRNRSFRDALRWLQDMCMRGELECGQFLSRFGLYDGSYLVDRNRAIAYMSGIAANMFRSIGLAVDLQGQRVNDLEELDGDMVDEVFRTQRCLEQRHESEDGRVWVRTLLPLTAPALPVPYLRYVLPRYTIFGRRDKNVLNGVLVLIHNATEAVQKQRELNVKSAIIQEVHHRVKNNLQTIAAILRIQARRTQTDEARQQLTEAVNRILTMSVIHEFMSQDEHQPINIRDVCQRVAYQVKEVTTTPDQEIEIRIKGPNVRLPASQATPVAMVINELMLNAVEHGLADASRGCIEAELRDLGDRVQIIIRNSGKPLPADFNPQQSRSLGLQIVQTLINDDLKGELAFESSGEEHGLAEGEDAGGRLGTCVLVTFPKRSLKVD